MPPSLLEVTAIIQAGAAIALGVFAWKSWKTAADAAKSTRAMEILAREAERRSQPIIRADNPRQVSPGRFRFDVYNDGLSPTGLRQVKVHVKEGKRHDSADIRSFDLSLLPASRGDKEALDASDRDVDRNLGPSEVRQFLAEVVNPDVPLLSDLSKGLILEITPVRGAAGSIWVHKRQT